MTHHIPSLPDEARQPLPADKTKLIRIVAAVVAVIAGVVCMAAAWIDPHQFFFRYLTGVLFITSIGAGALFWLLLHYITFSSWSMVVRRLIEHTAVLLAPAALLFLPLLLGMSELFPWARGEVDPVIEGKQSYLNQPFFVVRAVGYFVVWIALFFFFRRGSLQQDQQQSDSNTVKRLRKFSAPAMLLLALTTTFASFDWIMSLDPHWYSNIFGVYFWAGAFSSSLAVITLLAVWARRQPGMDQVITIEHVHDLGKFQLGLVCFWAYIGFSQYLLIWYAAIPEETAWYSHRAGNAWGLVSYVLAAGHFVLPFLVLLPRQMKRTPAVLVAVSVCLLFFHAVDLAWQVLPVLGEQAYLVHWIDVFVWMLVLAAGVWCILTVAAGHALAPVGDPRLRASMSLENE